MVKVPSIGTPVIVEWEDSHGGGQRWGVLEEKEEIEHVWVRSMGWITAKDRTGIQIHSNITDRGDREYHGIGSMTIPRSAIRKIKSFSVWTFSF